MADEVTDPELESIRSQILQLTAQYSNQLLKKKRFLPGKTPIPVAGKVLTSEDFEALVDSSLDGWLTAGRFTRNFERSLAKYVGSRNALFVNSGSSANLLALSALTSQKLGSRALRPGDEVITLAMGFPTTVNPIVQCGLVPVFVDIDLDTLDASIDQIEAAITRKTRAIMMAHTLGNPFNVEKVKKLCSDNNLWLIEDSCDALGSTFDGQMVGSFGDTASISFYPAHHITTGEGGAVLIQSPLVKKLVESFRDWGRDCYCATGKDNTCNKRFGWQLGDLPPGYDHKYIYSHVGYNLKATEMQAALGLSQLTKIELFIQKRKQNYLYLRERLQDLDQISIAKATPKSDPAWFGFPITLRHGHGINREELLRFLNEHQIGTRLVFAGNITKQPSFQNVHYRVFDELVNTDLVMTNSFWIGLYPGLTEEMLDYSVEKLREFILRKSRK